MQNSDHLHDCEIPDVPLAKFDEMEMNESESTPKMNLRPRNQQTPKRIFDDEKSDSTNSAFSSSLQDLVESFDSNVGVVLKDMNKNAEEIAPIKMRSQEEIISESQFWWTLTGNYGNLPPIDFDQSVIRRRQLAALDLHIPKNNQDGTPTDPSLSDIEEADCEPRDQLDFHRAVDADNSGILPVNADRVIEEIDEIIQAGDFMRQSLATQDSTLESFDSLYSSMRSPNICPDETESDFELKQNDAIIISKEEMNRYTQSKLLTIIAEMEQIIQLYNEELVRELARRDEFEYEKEIRNKFITLLIGVQEKRRKMINVNGKRQKQNGVENGQTPVNNNLASTSIPYDQSQEIPNLQTLEPLVKILKAMSDDSPQLSSLLTDYILNVVCPTSSTISVQQK